MIYADIFPFHADVWGTVSDWAAVTVYAITGYLIFRTLKSQQEVQQTQNELYKIERIRLNESIKPILKYSGSTNLMKTEDDNKKVFTIKVINETSSLATNISKIVSENKQSNQIFIPLSFSDTRKHLAKGDEPLLFHFLIEKDCNLSGFISFALHYQDIAGTTYKQGVFCICDEYGIEINPYLPEIVIDK
jgi:hypothetical protein